MLDFDGAGYTGANRSIQKYQYMGRNLGCSTRTPPPLPPPEQSLPNIVVNHHTGNPGDGG